MRGLVNLGSTCYLNTAIQCLYQCRSFRNLFITSDVIKNSSDDLIQALIDLFNELETAKVPYISPKRFIRSVMASFGNMMIILEQNDINEFYSILIDKLNTCVSQKLDLMSKEEFVRVNKYDIGSAYDRMKFKLDYAWFQHHSKEFSPFLDIIYGQQVSQVECGNCGGIHHNYEVFTSLPLGIGECDDINAALGCHFADHILNDPKKTDDDKWHCDKCKKSTKSIQSCKLWRIPEILVISLKRFDHNLQKNNKKIYIPRLLDLEPWTLSREKNTQYVLRSIAYHIGSFFGGHYFAVAAEQGNAFHIDDETINNISDEDVDRNIGSGYVFFYERKR